MTSGDRLSLTHKQPSGHTFTRSEDAVEETQVSQRRGAALESCWSTAERELRWAERQQPSLCADEMQLCFVVVLFVVCSAAVHGRRKDTLSVF